MPQNIVKSSLGALGYNFVKKEFLPKGKDEYYLRNQQNKSGISYRKLTAYEIEALVRNRNTSDDWNKILVSDAFNPELVKNCNFFGLVRIGKLEPYCLEFSDLKFPVGLYNSTIISCDFGDNVVIDAVHYLSHFIIGNEAMIINVNELSTTSHAKFGNGILKEGEAENIRIWMELCNENAGRRVIPFDGMLPGDAFLWSKYRDDALLMQKFTAFTEQQFNKQRGNYGMIGNRTVIKNCFSIKDVWVGTDAYIKGANKLKNLTVHSGPDGKTQIGEGCELVNGIINIGCRIFYGVKAVRFVMAPNSQLKYGARLINSYLGDNSTISCCEVLNALIFPAHEQHHNNSFLCAALVMGQSNIPAGATIGSNHNSRSPDGELVAGRGFWPGLCVSLKHNAKFASFTMLAKGDYAHELNVHIPFSLVSIDESKDQLVVMPAYWFMYNMYALARNSWKYAQRDKRPQKIQELEYDYLAPDSVNEMFSALAVFEQLTGKAYLAKTAPGKIFSATKMQVTGKMLLEANDPIINELEITAEDFENAKRKTVIIKIQKAYNIFKDMILYYGVMGLIDVRKRKKPASTTEWLKVLPVASARTEWINVGGQLVTSSDLSRMKADIKSGKIRNWQQLHQVYEKLGSRYAEQKTAHALSSLAELLGINLKKLSSGELTELLDKCLDLRKGLVEGIYTSREKDYTNPYRQLTYDNAAEMDEVTGSLADNSFIRDEQEALRSFTTLINGWKRKMKREATA